MGSLDSILNNSLMYCTLENDFYHFVSQKVRTVITVTDLNESQKNFIDEKLLRINESNFINLLFAKKLDLYESRIIEMIDGKQFQVAEEKENTLLNWFLLF